MGDLINLRVIAGQMPKINKIQDSMAHIQPNGTQIINLVEEKKQVQKKKKVQTLEKVSRLKKDIAKKNKSDSSSDNLINLYT